MTIEHRLRARPVIVMHPLENCLLGAIGFPCPGTGTRLPICDHIQCQKTFPASFIPGFHRQQPQIGQTLAPFFHIRSNNLGFPSFQMKSLSDGSMISLKPLTNTLGLNWDLHLLGKARLKSYIYHSSATYAFGLGASSRSCRFGPAAHL